MRPIVIVLILVALVLAGGAAFLVNMLLQREPEQVAVEETTETEVMVAVRDLAAGELLADGDLAWRAWPDTGVQADYITRSGDDGFGDVPGSAVRSAIRAGEPVTATRIFKRTDAGFLSGVLSPGMRAVAITVDESSSSGGFVLPGDRVDVVMTQKFTEFDPQTEQTSDRHVVQTVLEDVRVIAVDQTLNDVEETAVKASTVTLEVTPAQAETVALAEQMGRLTLALRSLSRGDDVALAPFQADYNVSRYLGRQIKASTRVLVAARDLPPGTLVRDQDLAWIDMAAKDLMPGYYLEGAAEVLRLRGALISQPVTKGAFLLEGHFTFPDDDGFLTNALAPGMRAYSIDVTPQSIVSGRISVGDSVDVILTTQVKERGGLLEDRTFSETIIEDARLIAIDRTYSAETQQWQLGQTATLEVSSKGVETLAAGQRMGTLSLAVRGQGPGGKVGAYTTDFEVSRAITAFVWGQTVPLPPGFEEDAEDEADAGADDTLSGVPQLAPIPAPTLAPLEPESTAPSAPTTSYGGQGGGQSVKVYRGGGQTTYEFSE